MSSDNPNAKDCQASFAMEACLAAHPPKPNPAPLTPKREFIRSATRLDMLRLGRGAPVGVVKSGPFKGRVYQRTLTGGIVRVK